MLESSEASFLYANATHFTLISRPYPPNNQLGEEVDNRIFGFEEPEERPVWTSQYRPNYNQGGLSGFGGGNYQPQTTTRRTTPSPTRPTTTSAPVSNNNIDSMICPI